MFRLVLLSLMFCRSTSRSLSRAATLVSCWDMADSALRRSSWRFLASNAALVRCWSTRSLCLRASRSFRASRSSAALARTLSMYLSPKCCMIFPLGSEFCIALR